ncbi:hypothetical protein [Leucobacter sp. M11]|uniref:hypothetical protein n=1 Tax=Leucobacter sp. M11 TaxID=2993565 RepID=UPI002D7EE0F5|nr:hypothetical protein [Leucobacter sp. M11]MEB4614190.1 hypothetical protein [Leucobacter sp. M11]
MPVVPRHPLRVATVLVFGFTALPLVLTGCAPSSGASLFSSLDGSAESEGVRLQAADSGLLEAPTHQSFLVDSIASGRLLDAAGAESFAGPLLAAGDLSVTDGLITQATISVTAPMVTNVVFALSEPVLLRRDGNDGEAFAAVGTLTYGETVLPNTEIRITPALTAEGGSVTASIGLPENFFQAETPDAGTLEVTVQVQPEVIDPE